MNETYNRIAEENETKINEAFELIKIEMKRNEAATMVKALETKINEAYDLLAETIKTNQSLAKLKEIGL